MPRPRAPQICCSSRCLRNIEPHEAAIAISCFAQTVGIGKQRTSKSQRMFLCPQCAMRVVTAEKEPPKTAPFDAAIFKVLLDLVGAHADIAQETWKQLQQRRDEILYPTAPALTEGEVIMPSRTLKAAV